MGGPSRIELVRCSAIERATWHLGLFSSRIGGWDANYLTELVMRVVIAFCGERGKQRCALIWHIG